MKHRIYSLLLCTLLGTSLLSVKAEMQEPNTYNNIVSTDFPSLASSSDASFSDASSSNASSSDASKDPSTPSHPPIISTQKRKITSIFNLDLITKPSVIIKEDQESWESYLYPFKKNTFTMAYGITEDRERALLTLEDFHPEIVKLDTPGTYFIPLRFGVHEDFAEDFYLPDSMAEYKLPIYISDPTQFNLYYVGKKKSTLCISWTYPFSDMSTELWYIESNSALSSNELSKANWTLLQDQCSVNVSVDLSLFQNNYHYYFEARHPEKTSDILHIIYSEERVYSENMEGVRDESGRDELPKPPIVIPTDPSDDDDSESDSSDTDDSESDSSDTDDSESDSSDTDDSTSNPSDTDDSESDPSDTDDSTSNPSDNDDSESDSSDNGDSASNPSDNENSKPDSKDNASSGLDSGTSNPSHQESTRPTEEPTSDFDLISSLEQNGKAQAEIPASSSSDTNSNPTIEVTNDSTVKNDSIVKDNSTTTIKDSSIAEETLPETNSVPSSLTEENTSVSLHPTASISAEEDTNDYTLFSGKRLRYMKEQHKTSFLRVKKNHITVDIPWTWEYFETMTDDSWLKVEITQDSDTEFTLSILSDTGITHPEVTLHLPWSNTTLPLALKNLHTGHAFTFQYLEDEQELTAVVNESGTFHLEEQETHSADSFFALSTWMMLLGGILSILALVGLSILFLRKKNFLPKKK